MRKTYLYQFFATYPRRATLDELVKARVAEGSHSQMTLTEMIEDGLAEGWLAVETIEGIDYYSKREGHE